MMRITLLGTGSSTGTWLTRTARASDSSGWIFIA